MDLNNKSVNAVKEGLTDSSIEPIYQEFQEMANEGMSPEEIVASMMDQGVTTTQMSQVLEAVGYSPNAVVELFQTVELMEKEKLAEQQASMQAPSAEQPISNPEQQNLSDEEIQQMANQVGSQLLQPEMQYGGSNRGSGPLFGKGNPPRPVYLPAAPAGSNVLGAAFLLDDFVGKTLSEQDKDGDGLMDGSFRDSKAKRARFKSSQNALNKYDIDFGTNNPADYVLNYDDLADGFIRDKETYADDLLNYSMVDFDTEKNKYEAILATRQSDYDKLGKRQQEQKGLIGSKKEGIEGFFGQRYDVNFFNENSLGDTINRLNNLNEVDSEIIANAAKNYESGQGLNPNRSSYDKSLLSPEDYVKAQANYRNIMLGNMTMGSTDPADFITNTPSIVTKTEPGQQERSIVELPREEVRPPMAADSYKDWAKKNQVKLQMRGLTTQAQQRAAYEAESEFKYGGSLPKAQTGIPGSGMGGVYADQLDFENLINNMQTDYAADTQAVADSQLQKENPALGATPLQNQQAITGSGPGSGMGSMFLDQQALQKELEGINQTDETTDNLVTNEPPGPTVKRKRSLGTAYAKGKNFIKNDPTVKAFGDVSEGLVMGANLANEFFLEKKEREYNDELRQVGADQLYSAVQDPLNKRGTFDANLGLAEPDNLVDYYAQAMYGKEIYKKGGEFEPHMMFDPVSGKGYKANVEADHNRFAKMGFIHQDEMQQGGEIEIDNDTLAALIAAGADIEIL